jgi:heterodisulfide reductase subunit B
MLLRPSEIGVDSMEEPSIMEDLLQVLGAEVIHEPMRTECCGSYHTVNASDAVVDRVFAILSSAQRRGGEVVVQSCPLCDFNLDQRQKEIIKKYSGFKQMPVLYFTQLLALALGLGVETCRFDLHYVDPMPLLKKKGFIQV